MTDISPTANKFKHWSSRLVWSNCTRSRIAVECLNLGKMDDKQNQDLLKKVCPPLPSLHHPDILHKMNDPRPFPLFHFCVLLSKNRQWGRSGNDATSTLSVLLTAMVIRVGCQENKPE